MRHYNIYGVVLTKCAENDDDKCAWCKEHPWRGNNWYEERTTAENAVCPVAPKLKFGQRCTQTQFGQKFSLGA